MEKLTTIAPVAKSQRVLALDVLRGFALLGILMVNMPLFHSPFTVMIGDLVPWSGWQNTLALDLVNFFFHGKFYVLFSLLFGVGFYFFLHKVEEAGKTLLTTFRRRMFILLIIGILHVVLLWYGDILIIYALLGFVLTWFRRKSDRAILVWAVVFLLFPVFFNVVLLGLVGLAKSFPESAQMIESSFQEQSQLFASLTARSYAVYGHGSFSEIIAVRLSEYSYALGGVFTMYPFVMAMFLIGYLAGRRRLLLDVEKHLGFFRNLLWFSLPFAIIGNTLLMISFRAANHAEPSIDLLLMTLGFAMGGPGLTFVYISLIVLALQKGCLSWLAQKISFAGRMALTNYLTQSIICTTLFYSYGFGLYGKVSFVQGVLLTLVIYVVQLIWSNYWLKYFRFGPFEWVWRSLTYRRFQPMKKMA